MNPIVKLPFFPPFKPYGRPRVRPFIRPSEGIQKQYFEAMHSQKVDQMRDGGINNENYETTFRQNLKDHVTRTEKLEKSAERKATLLKALFIGLLALGIVCAASFFLLPVLGSIATALGLSVTATLVAWQVIFLGGGLIAGLSFLPRRFIKGFEEEKNHFHLKADVLKQLLEQGQFRAFLAGELKDYRHHERIASAPDFAELYYLSQNLDDKKLDIGKYEYELQKVRNLMAGQQVNQGLEEQIHQIEEKLQQMHREVHELENETNDIRVNLVELDRG